MRKVFGESWTCHVCKEERPDSLISVVIHDMSTEYKLPPRSMKRNVRYCNDRTGCWKAARDRSRWI